MPDDSLDNTAVPESTAGSAAPKAAEKKHNKPAVTYADAGVDISSGDRAKQRIKMLARKTFNKQVLSEIGGFGGLFALDLELKLRPGASYEEVRAAMDGHILARAELMGTYAKKAERAA